MYTEKVLEEDETTKVMINTDGVKVRSPQSQRFDSAVFELARA